MWSLLSYLSVTGILISIVVSIENEIELYPSSSHNIIATNYTGLIVRAQYPDDYEECRWDCSISNYCSRDELYAPGSLITCSNYTPVYLQVRSPVTCVRKTVDDASFVFASVNITKKVSQNFTATLGCTYKVIPILSIHITVKDCQAPPPFLVHSTSSVYGSLGNVSCAGNQYLYHNNGSLPWSVQTTCLATAQWSELKNLECRKDTPILPYQTRTTVCVWIMNQSHSCNVTFSSNPSAVFVSIQKNGSLLDYFSTINGLISYEQAFQYRKIKVTSNDEGTYHLKVRVLERRDIITLTFHVLVYDPSELISSATLRCKDDCFVFICIVAGISVLVAVVSLFCMFVSVKNMEGKIK